MPNKVYLGDFQSWASIASNFQQDLGPEPDFAYAAYETPSYEGYADVVFKRDGKWFSVHGSHCSCYGLEGQWEPEEFNPQDHFRALTQDRRIVYAAYGSPDGAQKAFDEWLTEATKEPEDAGSN